MNRNRVRGQDGASAVEFALVAPFAFALLAMLMTIGVVSYNQSVLERTAEVGARAVAVPADPYGEDLASRHRSQADVEEVVRATSPIPITSLEVLVPDASGLPVPVDPATLAEGDTFTVRVTYDYRNPIYRLLRAFADGDPQLKYRLVAESLGTREQ